MILLLLAHAAATLFMVGVIWFVQVVHYPLFARVGRPGFATYSGSHSRLTGLVVGPPMLVEAATAVVLVVWTPPGISVPLIWTGLVLVAGILSLGSYFSEGKPARDPEIDAARPNCLDRACMQHAPPDAQ